MKKNLRRIPDFIRDKISQIDGNDIIAAKVFKLTQEQLHEPQFANLNISLNALPHEYVPAETTGTFCKRNINGYRIKFPDQSKVYKTYYAGERPIFGDWSKGSFSLYITRLVIPYKDIAPKELSLIVELLNHEETDDNTLYTIKVSTSEVLDKTDSEFENDLLFNLNILQESIHSVDVYKANSTRNDFLNSLIVNWEIFPPGERSSDFERITRNMRNLSPQRITRIQERFDFMRSLNPAEIIYGTSGMRRYFGAKFNDNLVIFENTEYGNALYILFENWQELSRLSRAEIQNRPANEFIRIAHTGNWRVQVTRIIDARH